MNPVNRNTMDELYQSTVEKTEYLKRNGYDLVEMWECNMKRKLEEDEDMKHYFDHYHSLRCEGDEQIKYVDFNSLYPYVHRVCRDHYRKLWQCFQLLWFDQMYRITTARSLPSRASVPHSGQVDVRPLQNIHCDPHLYPFWTFSVCYESWSFATGLIQLLISKIYTMLRTSRSKIMVSHVRQKSTFGHHHIIFWGSPVY